MKPQRHITLAAKIGLVIGLAAGGLDLWLKAGQILREHQQEREHLNEVLLDLQIQMCELRHGHWRKGECGGANR